MQRIWDVKNNGRGRAVLLGMVILLLIFSITGCGGNGGEEMNAAGVENSASESGEDEGATVFAVSTVRAAEGEIRDYLELNGDVTASRKVDTYPDASGKLSRIYVEVGQQVRKDQVIA